MDSTKLNTNIFSLFDFSESILFPHLQNNLYLWDLREHFLQSLPVINNFNKTNFPFVHFEHPEKIHIGKNVTIYPGALIEGPCFIDNNVTIGHSAFIRSGSIVCQNAVIGHATEINRSVLLKNSKAPHFNYIGDSIIGNDVNLGAHATLANLRLDKKEIILRYKKEKFFTNKKKLGSFVGDGSSIGCSCVLNPGTVLQKNTHIAPLQAVRGFI